MHETKELWEDINLTVNFNDEVLTRYYEGWPQKVQEIQSIDLDVKGKTYDLLNLVPNDVRVYLIHEEDSSAYYVEENDILIGEHEKNKLLVYLHEVGHYSDPKIKDAEYSTSLEIMDREIYAWRFCVNLLEDLEIPSEYFNDIYKTVNSALYSHIKVITNPIWAHSVGRFKSKEEFRELKKRSKRKVSNFFTSIGAYLESPYQINN